MSSFGLASVFAALLAGVFAMFALVAFAALSVRVPRSTDRKHLELDHSSDTTGNVETGHHAAPLDASAQTKVDAPSIGARIGWSTLLAIIWLAVQTAVYRTLAERYRLGPIEPGDPNRVLRESVLISIGSLVCVIFTVRLISWVLKRRKPSGAPE